MNEPDRLEAAGQLPGPGHPQLVGPAKNDRRHSPPAPMI
jgi:hypothetical protein